MNREQQELIEYLLMENRILKEQFDKTGKMLRLKNTQRRELAKRDRKLGWKRLQAFARIATPATIMAWHRRLIALKFAASQEIRTERQQEMAKIREQIEAAKLDIETTSIALLNIMDRHDRSLAKFDDQLNSALGNCEGLTLAHGELTE